MQALKESDFKIVQTDCYHTQTPLVNNEIVNQIALEKLIEEGKAEEITTLISLKKVTIEDSNQLYYLAYKKRQLKVLEILKSNHIKCEGKEILLKAFNNDDHETYFALLPELGQKQIALFYEASKANKVKIASIWYSKIFVNDEELAKEFITCLKDKFNPNNAILLFRYALKESQLTIEKILKLSNAPFILFEKEYQRLIKEYCQALNSKNQTKIDKLASFLMEIYCNSLKHPEVKTRSIALIVMVVLDKSKLVKLLLEDYRIDPSIWNNFAIRMAAKLGFSSIVEILLTDLRVDPTVKENFALNQAVKKGHFEIVKMLVDNEGLASVNRQEYIRKIMYDEKNPNKHMLAVREAKKHNFFNLKPLFERNCTVNPSLGKNSALRLASKYKRDEIVSFLIDWHIKNNPEMPFDTIK
ncbi:Ankyrin repeats (3 copies) [Candidatus Rubidus massiliensis]|nr:Ankyrin repeats (3 copies) [Candidatus Rubidus massiliensis]